MQRNACKPNRSSRYHSKLSGFGVHVAGVVGEICASKVYGGKLDQNVYAQGDNHAPDLILEDGTGLEVKTTLHQGENPWLVVSRNELNASTHLCLVQATLPDSGNVFPIVSKQDFMERMEVRDLGHGERFVLPARSFAPC
mgnify:CR=1 FL=1